MFIVSKVSFELLQYTMIVSVGDKETYAVILRLVEPDLMSVHKNEVSDFALVTVRQILGES